MTCDDCAITKAELSEAKTQIRYLQSIVDKRDEHRAEVEFIARKTEILMDEAREALAEARSQMALVKERNAETREMLERIRAREGTELR
jgi:hypothetical protein